MAWAYTTNLAYSSLTGAYSVAETVTGGTSGATGVVDADSGTVLSITAGTGTFVVGETLTGGTSGATSTLDSIANIVLTHSGTDTALSGLDGIMGAIKTLDGVIDVYTIADGVDFQQTGTLSWLPKNERLVVLNSASNKAVVTGTVTVGEIEGTNPDGSNRYSKGIGLVTDVMAVDTGGLLTFYGGEHHNLGQCSQNNTGQVIAYDTRFLNVRAAGSKQIWRQNGDADRVQYWGDCVFDGLVGELAIFNLSGIEQLSGQFLNSYIQPRIGVHNAAFLGENLSFGKNFASIDGYVYGRAAVDALDEAQATEVTNIDVGTGVRIRRSSNNREGHWGIFQEVMFVVTDDNGLPIEDAKVQIQTTDNGNRFNSIRADATGKFQNFRNFETGLFNRYDEISDVAGETGTSKVLLGRKWADTAGSFSDPLELDLYSKTNTEGVDDYDVHIMAYGKQINVQSVILHQSSEMIVPVKMLPDAQSVVTKAVADAYTEINTAEQFFDRANAFLTDNYDSETALIVNRVENTVNAGSYDVLVDATASSAFAFDGATITIKSDDFVDNITTTGEVFTANGAVVSGSISDINGDSGLTVTVPANYDNFIGVYPTKTDAENKTNVIATGDSFRYLAADLGGDTLWFRMENVDGSYGVASFTMFVAQGFYTVPLVVTSENAALGEILTLTREFDSMTELSGTDKVFTTTALGNAPSGNGDGAAVIAAAVWNKTIADHTTAGSTGKALSDTETQATITANNTQPE